MVERSLTQDFVAENELSAVKAGYAWAFNRYKAVIKDSYEGSFVGCIKVRHRLIGTVDEEGFIDTRGFMFFFEWKYDWPMSLKEAVDAFERKFNDT